MDANGDILDKDQLQELVEQVGIKQWPQFRRKCLKMKHCHATDAGDDACGCKPTHGLGLEAVLCELAAWTTRNPTLSFAELKTVVVVFVATGAHVRDLLERPDRAWKSGVLHCRPIDPPVHSSRVAPKEYGECQWSDGTRYGLLWFWRIYSWNFISKSQNKLNEWSVMKY